MVQKGDFYEAVAWKALERVFGLVHYEPKVEANCYTHACHNACKKGVCAAIHTMPDFLVEGDFPTFYHVCYWDAKETSHAKFWRSCAELAELKCFVKNARNVCIVFEAECDYSSKGWYPEFLRAFDILFDRAIFFSHEKLERAFMRYSEMLKGNKRIGTRAFYEIMREDAVVRALARILEYQNRKCVFQSKKIWKSEREACAGTGVYAPVEHTGERLRNAMLQVALIMGLLKRNANESIAILYNISRRSPDFPYRTEIVEAMCKLPISFRGGNHQFFASNMRSGLAGPYYCTLNDDLSWFVRAFREGTLPCDNTTMIKCIERTYAAFAGSKGARECFKNIRCTLFHDEESSESATWTGEKWISLYESTDEDAKYNRYAELLIASTKLGIYPLLKELNKNCKKDAVTRSELRALYSNAQGNRGLERRRNLIARLAKIASERVDESKNDTGRAYIFKLVSRIVGPQSAINPLEELVCDIVGNCKLKKGVRFARGNNRIPTLISDIAGSSLLGMWNAKIAFITNKETIPVFVSAMKGAADCAHKADEFAGHLRFARYRLQDGSIYHSNVRRGIAVLEGGYTDGDKIALHNAGFRICSISSLKELICGLDEK